MTRAENSSQAKESETGLVSFWDLAADIISYAEGLGIDPKQLLYETDYVVGSGKRKGYYKLYTYRPESERADFLRIGASHKLPWNSISISVREPIFSKCKLPEWINTR